MPEFEYVAREMSGQEVTGVLTAASEQEVIRSLSTQQLFPVRVAPAESVQARGTGLRRRVRNRHIATFYAQLADLLRAGVPLLRALDVLERQTSKPALKAVIRDIRDDVADGTRLAEALRRHPRIFPELAVSMVHAGEEGGFLEDVLSRIADFTEHQEELKSRVTGALVYPAFLAVVGTIVVICMLVFFVPKFEPIFERLMERGRMPWATTMLLSLSDALARWIFLIAGLVAVGVYAGYRYASSDEGRLVVDRLRLRSYVVGRIVRSLAIARFCRILGTLLRNGVPILQALRVAKDATGNRILSDAIAASAENVSAGKSLAGPLAASGEFPEEIVEMIAVGEEANNLEQVLIDIADSMERRTRRQLDIFVRLLEPLMLLVMAGVILFVAAGLLLPVVQSSGVR